MAETADIDKINFDGRAAFSIPYVTFQGQSVKKTQKMKKPMPCLT